MTRRYDPFQAERSSNRASFVVFAMVAAGLALLAVAVAPNTRNARKRYRDSDDAPKRLSGADSGGLTVVGKTVLISRPKADLYEFWRKFENLPKFMENIRSVEVNGKRSTWTIAAPAGQTVQAEVELVDDVPNERLAWKSTPDSQIATRGSVTFRDAPAGRGTYVEAIVEYEPPAGQLGRLVAELFRREPHVQARHELKRFKMLMETGEVATSARTRGNS